MSVKTAFAGTFVKTCEVSTFWESSTLIPAKAVVTSLSKALLSNAVCSPVTSLMVCVAAAICELTYVCVAIPVGCPIVNSIFPVPRLTV